MRYQKANEILPENLVELIQKYIDGGYVYIPRKQENRKDHLFIFKYSCKLFLINRSHPMLPPLRF